MPLTEAQASERVAIAEDVLERLSVGKLSVRYLSYMSRMPNFPRIGSLQKQIDQAEANCNVCALGSMFLSYVRLHNQVECEGRFDFDRIEFHLSQIFDKRTLCLIEAAFEGKMFHDDKLLDSYIKWIATSPEEQDEVRSQAMKMVNTWRNALQRKMHSLNSYAYPSTYLREICKNIVKNNGEFNLQDTTFEISFPC